MSKLEPAIEKLTTAWSKMVRDWEAAQQIWRDDSAKDFKQRHMNVLYQRTPAVRDELRKLDDLVGDILRRVN